VIFVDDSGPAERAGIEEGNRIAAVEGIDLRVSRDDAGDASIANAKVRRLQREISKLRPGDDVDLRVYSEGRVHSMTVKLARASDLPHRRGMFMIGDHMGMLPGLEALPLNIDGAAIGGEIRRALEKAMESTGRALEGVGRGLGGVRRPYQDDPDELPRVRIEPVEPMQIEPLAPSRGQKALPSKVPYRSALLLEDNAPHFFAAPVAQAALASDDDAPSAVRSGGISVNIAGLRLVPVGKELASYLGRGSEQGLLVIDVPAWARKVLQAGDVVLRVDGCPVRSGEELNDVAVNVPRFRDATLDLLREGEQRTVTLPARR